MCLVFIFMIVYLTFAKIYVMIFKRRVAIETCLDKFMARKLKIRNSDEESCS